VSEGGVGDGLERLACTLFVLLLLGSWLFNPRPKVDASWASIANYHYTLHTHFNIYILSLFVVFFPETPIFDVDSDGVMATDFYLHLGGAVVRYFL